MAVKGEGVASSIDAHVRESIEKMVSEIRSTIDDVRVAVDQQLKAALQSMAADVNSVTFLPHIEKTITELAESLEAARPVAAAATGADAARVKLAVQSIEQGKSQVDVLNSLLEQCLSYGSRAALFILRGETFSGWKGVGFAPHGGNDDNIKRFNAAPGLISQLDDLVRREHVVVWDGANLSSRLGGAHSERAILVPMVIKDKVAAAIYVDVVAGETAKLDPASIELLVFITGLLIDTLAIRKKIPSPSLQEAQDGTISMAPAQPPPVVRPAAPAAQPPPAAPAAQTPAAAPRPAAPPPRPAAPAFTPPPQPARPAPPAPAAPPRPAEVPVSPRMTGAGTTRLPSLEAPRPAPEAPAAATEERSSTQYIPPPGLARGSALAATGDEAKRHDEARRFARLLVSEIKLYNEAKVDQGRKNKDLYERLKEDIDRSRQMFDERIGQDIRNGSNYFYDELVRILADGQPDVLGL